MFACEAVDLDFLNTAPCCLVTVVDIGRPQSEVFAAFGHDPANWGEFYPGFDRTGRYDTPPPHGVGSRRTARFSGITFKETILAWEEGRRWAFRGDSVHWTIAYKPRFAFKLARPLGPRTFDLLLTRAGHNLERSAR